MAIVELEVEKCTKTSNGNHSNKLVAEHTVDSGFGPVVTKVTYYLFTTQENAVGFKAKLDTSLFDVVDRPFEFVDEAGNDQVATLKTLYPKRP